MASTDVHQKILKTAYRLFYQQGYRATGINLIIKESEVAKATFYNHFSSKEQLALEYLDLREKNFFRVFIKETERLAETPLGRVLAIFKTQEHIHLTPQRFKGELIDAEWDTEFHGCHFIKIGMESPPAKVQERVKDYQRRGMDCIVRLLADAVLVGDLPKDTDTEKLATRLGILIYGALLHASWNPSPVYFREAAEMAKGLLSPLALRSLD